MTEVQRPPLTAGEREQLTGWLDLQRSFVRMKCQGLTEEDAHRKLLPTYAECKRSNEAIAPLQLDVVEQGPYAAKGEAASLRYILCHLIEETARHVGHMDIVRELIDGKTGYTKLDQA